MGIQFRNMAEGTPSIDIDSLIRKQNDEVKLRENSLNEKPQKLQSQMIREGSSPCLLFCVWDFFLYKRKKQRNYMPVRCSKGYSIR